MKEYIAFQGSEFTIEWYFDSKGHSQALEYFCELPMSRKRKLLNLLRLMGDHGKIFDEIKFRHEGDGIYAFKPRPDRYLCFFFKGKKIVITNAFMKKSQKLPETEKQRACKAQENYELRCKEGIYYEKNNV